MAGSVLEELAVEKRTRRSGRRLSDKLEANPGRYLLLFTFIYFAAEICGNLRRPLWFDELSTYYLAELPSITQIWALIARGMELNPPLPFWITWLVHHTLGRGEVWTRLPAIAGLWIMCLSLYWFVRRRSNNCCGFLALLFPLFTYVGWEATYARGYGLMLGSAAAALLCWQLAAEGVFRWVSLAGLIVAIFSAESCHYYALYVPAALAVGELVRSFSRKRVDVAIWACLIAGAGSLLVYLPLMRSASRGLDHFWVTPEAHFLYESYSDLLGAIIMPGVLLIALLLWNSSPAVPPSSGPPIRLPRHETAACLAFAAMPLVVYLSTLFAPVAFFPRYVQPVVLGCSVLFAIFIGRLSATYDDLARLCITLAIWLCFAPWAFWQVAKAFVSPSPESTYLKHLDLTHAPALPVVVDSDYDFWGLYHYGPSALTSRIFMLSDMPAAVKYAGFDTGLRTLELAQSFRDFHVRDYRAFVTKNQRFLIARTRGGSWTIQKLVADGADLRLLWFDKNPGVFTEDHLLFLVTMPADRELR